MQVATTKDATHLERIMTSTGTKVALEESHHAVSISGRRSDVRRAKAAILDFLHFLLPGQFRSLEVHQSLLKSMGDAGKLAQIAADTGASLSLDRDMSSVLIRADDSDDCDEAFGRVNSLMVESEKLVSVMKFDASEAWILSDVVVGKGGSNIKQTEKDTGCSINVLKDEIHIAAESEDIVKAGRDALEKIVDQARKECALVEMPESSLSSFIGKGGAGIKEFSASNDVHVERINRRSSTLKITGKEECVARAHKALLSWLEEWEASHAGISIALKERLIPLILGKGGQTVRSVEKEMGCIIDINRRNMTLTAREGSKDGREGAIAKIQAMVDEEEAKAAERAASKAKSKQEDAEVEKNGQIHGFQSPAGVKEGQQLYQWILTGEVGNAIADVVYVDTCEDEYDHVVSVTKHHENGNELTYYEFNGLSVRGSDDICTTRTQKNGNQNGHKR